MRTIIWRQRHCLQQNGHDEQVVVVKQMGKRETIAFRVMSCLWISKVIVPLQLGYLHNQLWGLAIMYFPLFAAVLLLQLAHCPIEHLFPMCLYCMNAYIHVVTLQHDRDWLRAKQTMDFIWTNLFLLKVTGHCSLCLRWLYKETCLCNLYCLHISAQKNKGNLIYTMWSWLPEYNLWI